MKKIFSGGPQNSAGLLPAFAYCVKLLGLLAFIATLTGGWSQTSAQSLVRAAYLNNTNSNAAPVAPEAAIAAICRERESDPLGSTPIDVMKKQPPLLLSDAPARAGWLRAQRLLPEARALTIAALRRLGRAYNVPETALRAAELRVQRVTEIKAEAELHDNALVNLTTPTLIRFGTVFLAGLPSDEGLIAIIAHELTHLADGKEDSLQTWFAAVGAQAAQQAGLPVAGRRAEELSCDFVGSLAARLWVAEHPTEDTWQRRWARGLEHNCVARNETDQAHLSPHDTMQGLLVLDKSLAEGILYGRFTVAASFAETARTAPRKSLTKLRLAPDTMP